MFEWIKILAWICGGFFAVWFVCHWIVLEVRNHRNQKAPVVTVGAKAVILHPDPIHLPQGRSNGHVYFVTFRTDSGGEVKVYMGPDHYHLLKEGDRGLLTYQGERFWKFVPKA